VITFRDEQGDLWQLVRVEDQVRNGRRQSRRPAPSRPMS
jgi:hypothetical protein